MGLIALVVGAVLVGTWLIEQHLSSSQSATSGLTDMLANIWRGRLPAGLSAQRQAHRHAAFRRSHPGTHPCESVPHVHPWLRAEVV
jgi:hypothetical protein